jgi:hypothetical protein
MNSEVGFIKVLENHEEEISGVGSKMSSERAL